MNGIVVGSRVQVIGGHSAQEIWKKFGPDHVFVVDRVLQCGRLHLSGVGGDGWLTVFDPEDLKLADLDIPMKALLKEIRDTRKEIVEMMDLVVRRMAEIASALSSRDLGTPIGALITRAREDEEK